MQKKTEKELLEYIKLKDKLEFLNKNSSFEKKIKNPFETLTFNSQQIEVKNKKKKSIFLFSYKFWFLLLVLFSLMVSVFFSSLISSKLDPSLYKVINGLSDQINKPYVLTVGNFENFDLAKSKAIDLLPKLRQINIKELPTGNYTFEIDRYGSKEKAYSGAKEFTHDGFESVHVRYLPSQ